MGARHAAERIRCGVGLALPDALFSFFLTGLGMCFKFGQTNANGLRAKAPRRGDERHMDEVS